MYSRTELISSGGCDERRTKARPGKWHMLVSDSENAALRSTLKLRWTTMSGDLPGNDTSVYLNEGASEDYTRKLQQMRDLSCFHRFAGL